MEQNTFETGGKWTPGDIKCLIDQCEKNMSRFEAIRKKKVWEEISAEMQKIRLKCFTAEPCMGKWKGLKSMYKKIKDHNSTSGNSRKNWEYFDDMDKLLLGVFNDQKLAQSRAVQLSSENLSEQTRSKRSRLAH